MKIRIGIELHAQHTSWDEPERAIIAVDQATQRICCVGNKLRLGRRLLELRDVPPGN